MTESKVSLPKIGIRPCIDGRRNGVRESLEEQTMNMAKNAAQFLTANLRHACGAPVECVIADTTIGGVLEASACEDKFEREGVSVSISVTPCWCYGSETMDMNKLRPKAVWGFNGTERPGAVYLAAVLSAHAQMGLPAFGIYGKDVKESTDTEIPQDVQDKLLTFARAALAVASMKGKSYLSLGGVSMGIAGSMVNPAFFQEYLGMRNEFVDLSEYIRRIEENIFDPIEFEKAMAWVKANCKEGFNKNPIELHLTPQQEQDQWAFVVKMTLITKDLMVGNPRLAELGFIEESCGHNAIVSGFQGQRHWTDHFPNGDFMEAILNSSFDWNGIRKAFVVATENDCLNGVSMLFGHLLTNTAQLFSDVRTYWSPDAVKRVTGYEMTGKAAKGIIHLINSGASTLDATGQQSQDGKPVMKPFWDITQEEVKDMLNATEWCPADAGYFRGGGFSSKFTTKPDMPMTMVRLNLVKGIGPVLQIAEGYTVALPDDVHKVLNDRTDPTWPTTWFAPILTGEGNFTDVYSVMNNWGANHGAIAFGHVGHLYITLASMLRIPISMHNVAEERIIRPASWSAFGSNKEGADYRACAAYGPLYK